MEPWSISPAQQQISQATSPFGAPEPSFARGFGPPPRGVARPWLLISHRQYPAATVEPVISRDQLLEVTRYPVRLAGVRFPQRPRCRRCHDARELAQRANQLALPLVAQQPELGVIGADPEVGGVAQMMADAQHHALHRVTEPFRALAPGQDRVQRRARVGEQVGADVRPDVGVAHLPVQDSWNDLVHCRQAYDGLAGGEDTQGGVLDLGQVPPRLAAPSTPFSVARGGRSAIGTSATLRSSHGRR